jgi:hypothetical protein
VKGGREEGIYVDVGSGRGIDGRQGGRPTARGTKMGQHGGDVVEHGESHTG